MNAVTARFVALLRRYPYCALCAVLALALAGGCWYLMGRNEDLEIALKVRAKEGEAMLALLVSGSTQRQELASAREVARRIEENLMVETNLPENLGYFYKLEEQTKAALSVHQLSSPQSEASSLYKRIPFTLQVTGTYEQVTALLLALETGPRLVNITSFSYTRRDPRGSILALDLAIELLGKK